MFTVSRIDNKNRLKSKIFTCPGGSIGFSTANKADEHIIHTRIMLPKVLSFTNQWQKTRNLHNVIISFVRSRCCVGGKKEFKLFLCDFCSLKWRLFFCVSIFGESKQVKTVLEG